jgi:PAS domain S-box-containing protein
LTGVPSSLEALVGSSDSALGVLELPSSRVLTANAAMARLLGLTSKALVGSTGLDLAVPEHREASDKALRALADGTLSGYQAIRSFRTSDGPRQELSLWVCAVDIEGGRVGLISAAPLNDVGPPPGLPTVLDAPAPGEVVLCTLDKQWRIDRISHDVLDMLGLQPEEAAGLPVLGALHAGDVQSFLTAIEHARSGHRTVRVGVRLRTKAGDQVPVAVVLATLSDDYPPAIAFAFVADHKSSADGGTLSAFHEELQRINHDLRVAGVLPRLDRLPNIGRFPALSALSTREWQVLVMLLDGYRVASIAADLYVSPSTVRNHLSSIFSKVGAHSQADLIHKLRLG